MIGPPVFLWWDEAVDEAKESDKQSPHRATARLRARRPNGRRLRHLCHKKRKRIRHGNVKMDLRRFCPVSKVVRNAGNGHRRDLEREPPAIGPGT